MNFRADVADLPKDMFTPSGSLLHDFLSKAEERNIIKAVCARIGVENIVTRTFVKSKGRISFAGLTPAECVTEDGKSHRRVIILWWGNNDLELAKDTEVNDLVWFTATNPGKDAWDASNEFSGYLQANSIEVWARDRVTIQEDSGKKHVNTSNSDDLATAYKTGRLDAGAMNRLLQQPFNITGGGGDFLSDDQYLIGADLIINGIQGSGVIPAAGKGPAPAGPPDGSPAGRNPIIDVTTDEGRR